MIRGDAVYNDHFRLMVRDGIACGLSHPIEWLVSYDRGIFVPYAKLTEHQEFCNEVALELFELIHERTPNDPDEIDNWINDHYRKPERYCPNCNAYMDLLETCQHCGYTKELAR